MGSGRNKFISRDRGRNYRDFNVKKVSSISCKDGIFRDAHAIVYIKVAPYYGTYKMNDILCHICDMNVCMRL